MRNIIWAGLLMGGALACQRVGIPTRTPASASPTVLLAGAMYARHDSIPAVNFSAIFSRVRPDHSTEILTDTTMPATGRYHVRLTAGQVYLITLSYGRCQVEQQEFAVPTQTADIVKNFYLAYTDTTPVDHTHCLRGLKRYR